MNLTNEKKTLIKLAKRILKTSKPKSTKALKEIEDAIIRQFNIISTKTALILTTQEKSDSTVLEEDYNYCRNKAKAALQQLGFFYKIPKNPGQLIDIDKFDTESLSDELSITDDSEESESENEKMVQNKLELGKFVTSEVDVFNGNYQGLNKFINQIKIVKEVTETENIQFALSIIKSKISSTTISLRVEEAGSFNELIKRLEEEITRPSSILTKAHLKNLKQSTDALDYTKQLKVQADKLREAYLAEGVPAPEAEKYIINEMAESIKINCRDPALKMGIRFSTYNSVDALLEKVVGSSNAHETYVGFTNFDTDRFDR